MAGGRPRKSTRTIKKHLTKKEKLERELVEEKTRLSNDQLTGNVDSLSFYNDEAKAEYMRVVRLVNAIKLLDNLDQAYIKMYADAWAIYNQAIQTLANKGLTIEVPVGEFGTKEVKNPMLNAYNDAVKTINQCSTKLGLATTDRLKLQVPKDDAKPINKFLKFVK